MKFFLAIVFLTSFIGAATFFFISAELDAQSVTLDFERVYGSCVLCTLDVFVNGAKIGSVNSGKSVKFSLQPTTDNTYDISARLIPVIGPNLVPETKRIKVEPGSIIYARFEIDPWVFKVMAAVKLEVAIEKRFSPAIAYLPASISSSGAKVVAEYNEPWSKVPWDAIGAIAGIVGTIAAVLALFKR